MAYAVIFLPLERYQFPGTYLFPFFRKARQLIPSLQNRWTFQPNGGGYQIGMISHFPCCLQDMNRVFFLFPSRITFHQEDVVMVEPELVRPDIEGMVKRGEIGNLIAAVRGSDPDTMSDILDALVGSGEAAIPALLQALRDGDEQIHMVASIALEKIGKVAVLPLIKAFREKDGLVRVKIADILANIGGPALEEIISALRDPDEEVRVLSALVLGEMRNPGVIDPLISALADGSENVRAQAAVSLGEMGDARARDALTKLAEGDGSPVVRQVAGNALLRILEVMESSGEP